MELLKFHYESIDENLQCQLLKLMQIEELGEFRLVGGTAFALYLGHRQSEDIDIFSVHPFDADVIAEKLIDTCNLHDASIGTNSVSGFIGEIKIDIIARRYPWLDDVVELDGIRIASLRDIAAMKLNAVSNRGCKKDFWDIAALLNHFTAKELLSLFSERYPHINNWQVVRSLTYFDDAEDDPDPIVLDNSTWEEVKTRLLESARSFL